MSLKYYLDCDVSFPLLPIMSFQGKKTRKKVPKIMEARNPKGYINNIRKF
jgi:hypothetical protein